MDNDVVPSREYSRIGDSEEGGLRIVYTHGDVCNDGTNNITNALIIDLYCNDEASEPLTEYVGTADGGCTQKVKVISKYGCYKFTMNSFFKWIHKNSYLFGALLIIMGITVGVFGKKLFKPTICIIGTFAFLVISMLFVFSVFFNRDTETWVGWVVFSVCLLLGCFVGLVLAKLSKLGVAILAGWGGFLLGLILYNSFMYKLDSDKRIVFWIFNISMAIIAGILSIYLFSHAVIIATSIVGSYAFIRGISLYAGGFPDELDLIKMIEAGDSDSIDGRFYGYMAGFFVASIICIIFQYKMWNKDQNAKYQHPYHYRR